jgi:hypothetical protein
LQLLIRAGFTDASIDLETRHLLAGADAVRESDDGVALALLAAAQAELTASAERVQRAEAKLAAVATGCALLPRLPQVGSPPVLAPRAGSAPLANRHDGRGDRVCGTCWQS